MSESRFSVEREVSLITGKVVELGLVDEVGELPTLYFKDPSDLYEWETAFMKEYQSLLDKDKLIKAKNEQLADVKQILQKHNQTEILKELGWD